MDLNFGYRTIWNVEPVTPTLYLGVTGRGKNPHVRLPVLLVEDVREKEGFRLVGWTRKLHGYKRGRIETSVMTDNAWGGVGGQHPWSRIIADTHSLEEAERLLVETGKIFYG